MRPRRLQSASAGASAAIVSAASLAQSTCPIYTTAFDAFAGPPDWSSGSFSVQWCLNGATVTSSNYCPTGNALKLDASTDDPVILVHVGDVGCASVTISFSYGQFATTGTTVKAGLTAATTVSCSLSTPTLLGTLATTGGACTSASFTVPLNGAKGVAFRIDHGNTGTTAITIDDLAISVTACCGATHGCCDMGFAGCSDGATSACVCAVDPYCCQTEWDAQCVDEVTSLGCGSCGAQGGSCLTAFSVDFGTAYSTTSVCQLFPQLFESCEGSPPTLTISGACASSGDPAMRFGTGFPYSAAITRCLDLSAMPAPTLRFRWSRNAGSLGPRLDYRTAQGPWVVAWQPTVGEGTTGCVETALDLSPLASLPEVQFRFASGSSVSNGAAIDDIAIEPGQPPHDCCTSGSGGCANASIESCACIADAYCCDTSWDELCIAYATFACGAACPGVPTCGEPGAGHCLLPHGSPFCSNAACCSAVCAFDPFCCLSAWDEVCASEAAATCSLAPPADLDGDGRVGGADLAMLLAAWGPVAASAAADFDANGVVGAEDLAVLLAEWTTG